METKFRHATAMTSMAVLLLAVVAAGPAHSHPPDDDHPDGKQKIMLLHYSMRTWLSKSRGTWHLYGHSHGTLPDPRGEACFDVGVDCWNYRPISYDEVKNTLYDPVLRDLVIAEDLTSSVEDALQPNTSLAAALEILDRHRVQSWPVVQEGRLLGIVRRTDIYAMMRRG